MRFPDWLPHEAAVIIGTALDSHPSVAEAGYTSLALWQDRKSADSFYDATLSAAGGASRAPDNAPETSLSAYMPDDATGMQAGLSIPLRLGAHVGIGAAQRRLSGALPDGSSAWQTVAGARISIPLMKDRGFALQSLAEEKAEKLAVQGSYAHAAVQEQVSWNAASALAFELYSGALAEQCGKALERVKRLLDETSERVKLETVAEYQLFPAQAEVQFKLDDLRQYAAAYTNSHSALELALGGVGVPYQDTSLLHRWANLCATSDVSRIIEATGSERPEITAAKWAVQVSEAQERSLAESMKSSLTLTAGIGYQGEREDFGIGDEHLLRERTAGFDAAIVWSRPLSLDSREAALKAQKLRTQALREELNRLRNNAASELRQARALYDSAVSRLAFSGKAVESAARALESETARLKMGEGRSRNVLDAQADMSSAEGRVNLVSYSVICAFIDLMRAGGVRFSNR